MLYNEEFDVEYRNTPVISTFLPPVDGQNFDDATFLTTQEFLVEPPTVVSVQFLNCATFRDDRTSLQTLFSKVTLLNDQQQQQQNNNNNNDIATTTPSASYRSITIDELEFERVNELRELRQQLARVDEKLARSAWYGTDVFDGLGKFSFSNPGAVTLASLDSLLRLSRPLTEFSNDVRFFVFLFVFEYIFFYFCYLRRMSIYISLICVVVMAVSQST